MRQTLMLHATVTLALLTSCASRPPQATSFQLCHAYAEARGWTQITEPVVTYGQPRTITIEGRAPIPQDSNMAQCEIEGGRVVAAQIVGGPPL